MEEDEDDVLVEEEDDIVDDALGEDGCGRAAITLAAAAAYDERRVTVLESDSDG